MRRPVQLLVPLFATITLSLAGCRTKKQADPAADYGFEATVSIVHSLHHQSPTEEKVAEELKERAEFQKRNVLIDEDHPGDSKLLVYLKAESEAEARAQIDSLCQSVRLELRAVHPESGSELPTKVQKGEAVAPGYKVYEHHLTEPDRTTKTELLLLSEQVEVTGRDVLNARPSPALAGVVEVRLSNNGGERMMRLTKDMQKGVDRLAIVLDDEVKSAPVVNDILSSQFIIHGINGPNEREDLCASLMSPLSTDLKVEALRALHPAP